MPYIVSPPHMHWRLMVLSKLPGQEPAAPLSIDVFPARDCPPIRRTTANAHPLHTIILGRRQLRAMPNYAMICNQDFVAGPVPCYPARGNVLVNASVHLLLLLHDDLVAACRHSTIENWQQVIRTITPASAPQIEIPALWTVLVACSDADSGSVIECIHVQHQRRFYAELLDITAWDAFDALFVAKVLGLDEDRYCAVRMPVDFVEPYLIPVAGLEKDSIESVVGYQTAKMAMQPGVAHMPTHMTSSALLTEKIVYSNIYDGQPAGLLLAQEQFIAETRMRTEHAHSPISISIDTVTEEFLDAPPATSAKKMRKRHAPPGEDERPSKKQKVQDGADKDV